MGGINIEAAIANPVARGLFRGMVRGVACKLSIGQLRVWALTSRDVDDLERAQPRFTTALRFMVQKFPSIRHVQWPEVSGWIAEANPVLATALEHEPEVAAWLKNAWENGLKIDNGS